MKFFSLIIGLGLLGILRTVNGSNILFFSAFSSKSHKNVLDPVAEELGKRGHNVVFFTSIKDTRKVSNVTEVYSEELQQILTQNLTNFFQMKGFRSMLSASNTFIEASKKFVNIAYAHPLIATIIQNPRNSKTDTPKYDLLVVNALMNDFALPLAYRMQIPVVYISPAVLFPYFAYHMNIPFPLSYVTTGLSLTTCEMTFLDRTRNALSVLFMYLTFVRTFFNTLDNEIKQHISNVPPVQELLRNVSFVISNDHPAMGRSVPTMPYYLQLGGMHCKPAEKLPQELEDFMQSAVKDGVIYFSLGSVTKGASMPIEMRQKLAETFARLPQKILWKNEDIFEGMSDNVKFIKWAPQQDILAHPNVKLFISHAGGLSTQEAGYHGCPVLAFPLVGDQFGNIANAISLGFGEYLDWTSFTTEELLNKIKLMLEDKSYRLNAQKVSHIFKDRPEHPAKTAAHWLEYVIRHNGAPHLKSGAENLNFFQYFLLDIIVALFAAVLSLLVVLFLALKWVFWRLFGKKRTSGVNRAKNNKHKKH